MIPLVELSPLVLVVSDVAAWGAIHAGTGYYVHRRSTASFAADRWWSRLRRAERDGSMYARLGVRRWKDRLPEAGDVFAGGLSKASLPPAAAGGLQRFAVETRRAELGHWLCALGGPLFALWNPLWIAGVMMLYGVAVNVPFVVVQRYNRARVLRVLARRPTSSDAAP